ncbi:hypothetical protein [Sulfurimonas autotrophica]|uniref:Type II secretion system protein n=1 Tax=Sulfurimonas autotrophica (strain ATCC BAA-671 / DSM 16294 / JCM 11897 / OK10) TaxID=563040 RepID=E0UQA2_SULAO|nr:hypothetical protein [Sulfurimonas autotrophica]ADN09845.1 conserved hypothetical protein [Sulfurimonas autotrophica DSM 16294]
MQRKNSILKRDRHRSGIAMIMAIAVIVIIATIMALAISLTSQTTKRTTDVYLYEQSALLAHGAAEYALLRISQNPPCTDLDETFTQGTLYNITINLRYIYDSNTSCIANGGTLYTTVTTPEQNGSVLMDITVDVNDTTVASEPIRYFKRTLQKL